MYIPLYNEKEIKKIKRTEMLLWVLTAVFGVAAAGLVIWCMISTNSLNASKTEAASVMSVTCYGIAAMLLLVFFLLPKRREHAHAVMLSRGNEAVEVKGKRAEILEGPFTLEGAVFRIPNSIVIRKLKCGERKVSIVESRVSKFISAENIKTVHVVNGYVAGFETAESDSGSAAKNGNDKTNAAGEYKEGADPGSNPTTNVVVLKKERKLFPEIRRLLSVVPAMILWLLISVFAIGFLFNFVTDTKPDKKVSVYADVAQMEDRRLEYELSRSPLPQGIRMVKVHPFSYAMFGDTDLLNADLYIIPESKKEQYKESLSGEGILVYDSDLGDGVRTDLITYAYVDTDEDGNAVVKEENYYLFFGANSLHNSEEDRAAREIANRFLSGAVK